MAKIVILMSDTGGGHRASAQALQAGFVDRYGDRFQVEIVELWRDYTPWPINQLPKSYGPIVNRGVWFWKFLWDASQQPRVVNPVLNLMGIFVRRSITRAFEEHQPDLVISVHPLMQQLAFTSLRDWREDVPFVTVITDLGTINPLWLFRKADRCFVPTEEAYQQGLRAGLRPTQLVLSGLPIRPTFAHPPLPEAELRRKLGLAEDRLTALVVSGGEGMGPVAITAHMLAEKLAADGRHAQLVVICGRNEQLRQDLANRAWPIPVHIHGFVENMPEWMVASDCIVTKAGPGTIAEALITGLPILLKGFIPGQEEGNVPYVVDHGVGAYSPNPTEIAAIVSHWFGPEQDTLADMAQKAKALGHPQATFDIVEEIAGLISRD
jgi:1,2-diacylglycerol 3-beta-galactosyltransferase